MTDHAKMLADALRKTRANHGIEFSAGLMGEITDALAAYDARPQASEMADKLNGLCEDFRSNEAARPQASGDLVERRIELEEMASGLHNIGTWPGTTPGDRALLWKASEEIRALSRASQPETVTEEQVKVALKTYTNKQNEWRNGHRGLTPEDMMRAALTAALTVRK